MNLTAFSIRNPITVVVGVFLVVLFGIIGLFRLPVQLTPDLERPTITVRTYWTGGAPVEVEREIVAEQEERLKSVDGLVRMTSESRMGRGAIDLEFDVGTNMDAALLKVANHLDQVPRYPAGANRPLLISASERRSPMAFFVLVALPGRTEPLRPELDFVEENIRPIIERVAGVAAVNVYGGTEREMQVIVDPQKLAARKLTIQEVIQGLAGGNRDTSAGNFTEGKRQYIVRTVGQYHSPEDIERVVLKVINGDPVFVRDIARVQLGFKKPTFTARNNGEETVLLSMVRATGANSLTVMAEIKKVVAELNDTVLADRRIRLVQTDDETTYIRSAISLVKNNLIVGGTLAVAVLLLFLRSISSTLIIATSIPISVIGTFFLMFLFGRNINVISLAGMAFAVGMVVDAAIVVLENIYRHIESGKTRREAALLGTREVWGAILASVLTTVAVFAPILYIQDEAGQLFRDIAIAICSAVLLSLIVSITVIPAFSALILRVRKRKGAAEDTEGWRAPRAAIAVSQVVYWVLGRVWAQIGIVALLTAASISMALFLAPKTEYLPVGNRDIAFAFMLPPPGYSIDELDRISSQISQDLKPYWSAQPGSKEAAALDAPPMSSMFFYAWGEGAVMGIRPHFEYARRVREYFPVLRRTLAKIPGVISIVYQPSLFARGIGAGRSIDVEITGPDLERILALGTQVYDRLKQIMPDAQLRPVPSLDLGNPEVRVTPDRNRLAEVGLNATDLGLMVDLLLDGTKVSEYHYFGEKIDLTAMGEPDRVTRTQDLAGLPVKTPSQSLVTLGSLADIATISGPVQINRIERERAITIQVIPPETLPLQQAMEIIEAQVVAPLKAGGDLGSWYQIKLAGTADKLTQTRQALSFNFLLALLITYLLMTALFASFVYPFIIMFTVPLAAAGGFLGLFLVNTLVTYQALDVLTMLGFVILIGIVVNNAILIVHQGLNNIRYGGMGYREAVAFSVRTRLRPIFMSTTTSICGMLPLVLFPGAGSELYRGLGGVVIGGLAVSTLFTVFLIPSLFMLVLRLQARLGVGPQRIEEPAA